MKLSDLSQKDKLAIAEYIYSQEAEILIKSDAERVIEVFKSHNIKQAESIELEEYAVLNLINSNVSLEDRNIIMQEYLTGKL